MNADVRVLAALLVQDPDGSATVGAPSDAGGFIVTSVAEPGRYLRLRFAFEGAAPLSILAPVARRTKTYESASSCQHAFGDG